MSIRLIDIKQTTQIVVLDWGVGLPFLFYQRNYWSSRNFQKRLFIRPGLKLDNPLCR